MAVVVGDSEVVEQYVYDPYGALLAVETLEPNTTVANRIAHQGLFFERFADDILSPPLDVGAPGVYYNRNRHYQPYLSRFLQRDVQQTVQPLATALAFNGHRLSAGMGAFELLEHYVDGLNLYGYLGGNPVSHRDALGLAWDEDIDNLMWALTGERAAAMHHAFANIGFAAQTAATLAVQASLSALFPPYGVYLSLNGAADAIEDMLFNGGPTPYNTLQLGLSIVGGAGSTVATLRQATWAANRIGAGIRSAYDDVAAAYSQMGKAGSGFGGSADDVTRVVARPFRPRHTMHNGVWFDEAGFPNFTPYAKYDVRITPTGNRPMDFAAANRAAGLKPIQRAPDG